MDLTLRNARTTIEDAVVEQILLDWGYRLQPPAPDAAALRALPTSGLTEDALRFVAATGRTYRWKPFEGSADDGVIVVQPVDVKAAQLGRWLQTSSTRSTGYLRRCELYNDAGDPETLLERLLSVTPAVVVSFQAGHHKAKSLCAGALYEYRAEFTVMAISVALRGEQTARQGSLIATEAALDPGTAAMIGDCKKSLAGSDLGLPDVAATEILDERVVSIGEARRRAVEELDIVVYATLSNPDDDVVELGDPPALNLQYELAGPFVGAPLVPMGPPDLADSADAAS